MVLKSRNRFISNIPQVGISFINHHLEDRFFFFAMDYSVDFLILERASPMSLGMVLQPFSGSIIGSVDGLLDIFGLKLS